MDKSVADRTAGRRRAVELFEQLSATVHRHRRSGGAAAPNRETECARLALLAQAECATSLLSARRSSLSYSRRRCGSDRTSYASPISRKACVACWPGTSDTASWRGRVGALMPPGHRRGKPENRVARLPVHGVRAPCLGY